jgi:hypothetical protein
MKKILVLLSAMLLSFPLFSQEDLSDVKTGSKEFKVNTLFGKDSHHQKIQVGGFIEMNAGYTKFGSKNVFLPGMNIGVILNHNWSVGLAGSFIANPGNLYYENIYHPDELSAMYGANMVGGYGGGLFEYTAFPKSVVHFSVPVIIGAGYFAYVDDLYYGNNYNYDYHNWDYNTIDWNVCFVVEPGVKLEFNIVKMLRLGLGVSYRYSPNFELVNTPTDLINQFTGRFSIRFGKF